MGTADPLDDLEFAPRIDCDARAGRNDHAPATHVLTLRVCPGGCPSARLLLCEADVARWSTSGVKVCGKCGHRAPAAAWVAACQGIDDAVPPQAP